MNRLRHIPWDIEVAWLNFGANCGPSAFAAATGTEVCRIMKHFAHFEHSPWTNLSQMKSAFMAAGHAFSVHRQMMPHSGVALIQWLGPWTDREFFSSWSLPYTHWIAVDGSWVFDHAVSKWQPVAEWSKTTAARYIAATPRAHGWAVKYGIEVGKLSSACRKSVVDTCVASSW